MVTQVVALVDLQEPAGKRGTLDKKGEESYFYSTVLMCSLFFVEF